MTGNSSTIRTGLWAVIATVMLSVALMLPTQAFAANDCADVGSDPTAAQYCSPGETDVAGVDTEDTSSTPVPVSSSEPAGDVAGVSTSSDSGSLPFTGLDVGTLLLVAAALTGAGLLLRRLTAFDRKI